MLLQEREKPWEIIAQSPSQSAQTVQVAVHLPEQMIEVEGGDVESGQHRIASRVEDLWWPRYLFSARIGVTTEEL